MAAETAAEFGLILDDWQTYALRRSLGRHEGRWATPEAAVVVPRQNGKGGILEGRALYGLFVLHERLQVWTAHEYKTAREAFRRIWALLEDCGEYAAQIERIRTANGEEAIELTGDRRLRFLARTAGSGRGLSGDLVILDEAYKLSAEQMAALMPTLLARSDPQLWYASMAGTVDSEVLASVRTRAEDGDDALCYLEWSADPDSDYLDDRDQWQQANPGLPHRVSWRALEQARQALDPQHFARECLCVWDPDETDTVIDADTWQALGDTASEIPRGADVAFAVDVPPERGSASIAVAGRRDDGRWHVELVDRRDGTGWVVDRLVDLDRRWPSKGVGLDPTAPAGSLITDLQEAGVEPVLVGGREFAQACGAFYDDATSVSAGLVHRGQTLLNLAVEGARRKSAGDAWRWARRDTTVDLSPLVAVTVARHVAGKPSKRRKRTGKAAFI